LNRNFLYVSICILWRRRKNTRRHHLVTEKKNINIFWFDRILYPLIILLNIILFIDIEIKILQSHWYSLNLWLNKKERTSFMNLNFSTFYINIEKMNVGLKIIIWIVKDFSWKKINHVDLTNGKAFIMINWMIPLSYYWETCRTIVEIFNETWIIDKKRKRYCK
jgi:hypothetical protein